VRQVDGGRYFPASASLTVESAWIFAAMASST
jgi:hypothetical protein